MNIIIYEDHFTENLKPFSLNHATFEIQSGIKNNLSRIIDIYGPDNKYILLVRKEIESIIRYRYPKLEVNPDFIPEGKFINGNLTFKQNIDLNHFPNSIQEASLDEKMIVELNDKAILCFKNIWDPIFAFKNLFGHDYKYFINHQNENNNHYTQYKNKSIYIADSANLKEGVILDDSAGPIIIGENVTVDIGALLQGPLFIDNNSYISIGAKIRPETLIGKNCKIGGEVSNSIFYKNSNKAHDGFIGHSFIGEWVNIGAGTNNSNLKNNYSNVKFTFNGKENIDSNKQFLGSMIGDYSRLGISTMLNTGTYIGLGCNIFGSGFQDKYVPSFSWGDSKTKTDFEKFVNTCKKMYIRRDKKLSKEIIVFLKNFYKNH